MNTPRQHVGSWDDNPVGVVGIRDLAGAHDPCQCRSCVVAVSAARSLAARVNLLEDRLEKLQRRERGTAFALGMTLVGLVIDVLKRAL